MSFWMTLNELEWLNKIHNDAKRRAISMRQPSFLFLYTRESVICCIEILSVRFWRTLRSPYVTAIPCVCCLWRSCNLLIRCNFWQRFAPSNSLWNRGVCVKILERNSKGFWSIVQVKRTGIMKNWRFSTNISLYFGNDTRYTHSYNGTHAMYRMVQFPWPWMTLTQISLAFDAEKISLSHVVQGHSKLHQKVWRV